MSEEMTKQEALDWADGQRNYNTATYDMKHRAAFATLARIVREQDAEIARLKLLQTRGREG